MRFPVLLVLAWLVAVPVPVTEAATLAFTFTNDGAPLENPSHAKFYVYKPGKRENYVAWGHGAKSARFPDGEYDLVIRYRNGEILKEIVREEIELAGEIEETLDFRISVARLTLEITSGGRPIQAFSGSYAIYRGGKRDRPVARKRPGQEVTIRPGTYDIKVDYRNPEGLETVWLEGYYLEGARHETVELALPLARLTVTVLDHGRPVAADGGTWRVYKPGQRSGHVAERGSGEVLSLEPGPYDVGIFYADRERWLMGIDLAGEDQRQVEMALTGVALRVDITGPVDHIAGAWCSLYHAGRRESALLTFRSGDSVPLDAGTYDIGCFLREGGLRAERWFEGRRLTGQVQLEAVLDPHPAFLRVLPRDRKSRRRNPSQPGLLFLLDSSTNMRSRIGSETLFDVARDALEETVRELPAEIDVGLRVFGAALDGQGDCDDSDLLVPVDTLDRRSLFRALEPLRPGGRAALQHALTKAAADLPDGTYGTIVLLTGSTESCSGDPCRTAARLVRDGDVAQVHVIGLGIGRNQKRQLDCIGRYHQADTPDELRAALRDVIRRRVPLDAGTVSLFRAGRRDEWVTGGVLGEKIGVTQGRYDVLVVSSGKEFFWRNVDVEGYLEATAGRRAPR